MSYIAIDEDVCGKFTDYWYSIGDLISLAHEHDDKKFYFVGTDYSPNCLISWRGSYNLPAILASTDVLTGGELYKQLNEDLNESHYGYKGGEYNYDEDDIFRVVLCESSSSEHSVDGYHVIGDIVYLNTNINTF